jgi:flagellar hook-associated protein 2
LQSTLAANTSGDVFNRMDAVVSNNEYLTVSETSEPNAAFRDSRVDIQQVAGTQVNRGDALQADEALATEGIQSFAIEQGGNTYNFAVDVNEDDTASTIQQRMAEAINASDVGVTATVTQDENGMSALTLESDETGAANAFTVEDTEGTLAAQTGIAQAGQAAQDAIFRVDIGNNRGATQTSATNDIDLGGGVMATLRQATEAGGVTVTAERDTQAQTDAMRELVGGINDLLDAAQNGPANNRLQTELGNLLRSYGPSLERAGIGADDNGRLQIDEGRLSAAAENGTLSALMNSPVTGNYGFTNNLNRIAENASGNTRYANAVTGPTSNNASSGGPSNWSAMWQNAMNSYRQNTNNYAYMFNSPGAIMNLYA